MNKLLPNKKVLQVLFLCLLNFSCGLFSPENAEDPLGKTNVDPLNFKAILQDNIEKFDFEDYNSLLHENFIYVDPDGIIYNRERTNNRLKTIEAKHVQDTIQNIKVIWYKTNTNDKDPLFDKSKEITLMKRSYEISIIDTVNNDHLLNTDTTEYKGEATFKLRYHQLKEEWVISYWRDIPEDGLIRSFFHPDFSD